MRRLVIVITALSCACQLNRPGVEISDTAAPSDGGASGGDASQAADWWDPTYAYRRPLTVTTGAVSPDNGYQGYTVRLTGLDTMSLIADGRIHPGCADIRVVHAPGDAAPVALARHVVACNEAATEVRFALALEIDADRSDENYFLYYGNLEASEPQLGPTDVYLWHDDANVDRIGDYQSGRIDQASGWTDNAAWNDSGYYTYDTGDNSVSTYRRAVRERDVLIEAEWFHTDCNPNNMVTGMVVRGIIESGMGGNELADHYYTSIRAHQPGCNGSGYSFDGDIHETQRTAMTALNGPNPPEVVMQQWRKQALAAWGINPTNLTFWDADTPWPSRGFPDPGDVLLSGQDGDDYEGAGFAGLWMRQDQGQFRNVVIRRYIEPEPTVTAGPEQAERDQ